MRSIRTEADPVGMDIYISKALKYEYAPDTYISFPIAYFHYEEDGPLTRTSIDRLDKTARCGSD
ncbi:MAG: hypothetical protein U5K00_15970 [Melioribacteraceae bacterium]|nr:hypothetical protein [Melioribacteraceae bacterium]